MAQDDDGAMVSQINIVEDTETGVIAASGATVVTDGDVVAAEGFQAIAVPDNSEAIGDGDSGDEDE